MTELTFECIRCNSTYSETELHLGLFLPTGICVPCYRKLKASAHFCFGKQYEEHECPDSCPDRSVCRDFVKIEEMLDLNAERRKALLNVIRDTDRRRTTKVQANRKHPFTKGSVLRHVFEMCLKGTTIAEIQEFCESIGASAPQLMRNIRKGYSKNGFVWEPIGDADGLSGRPWKIHITERPKA